MSKQVPLPHEYGWLRMGDSGGPSVAPSTVTWWPPPASIHFRVVWWAVVIGAALHFLTAKAAL